MIVAACNMLVISQTKSWNYEPHEVIALCSFWITVGLSQLSQIWIVMDLAVWFCIVFLSFWKDIVSAMFQCIPLFSETEIIVTTMDSKIQVLVLPSHEDEDDISSTLPHIHVKVRLIFVNTLF